MLKMVPTFCGLLGLFRFRNLSKPWRFSVLIWESGTIKTAAMIPSISPVGTYQISIVGTVTVMPPRFPAKGAMLVSIPTANAVQTFDTQDATNTLAANRRSLKFSPAKDLTTKKLGAPMITMLKMLAPKLLMPPSPMEAWRIRVRVMLIIATKGPKTIETMVPPKKCQVLAPLATGNSTSWITKTRALTMAMSGII